MIQKLESGGGLNVINIKAFCHSLSASWIIRILEGNPDEDNWVQLPKFFLKMLDIEGLNFKFNFDESVSFPDDQRIPHSSIDKHLYIIIKHLSVTRTYLKIL